MAPYQTNETLRLKLRYSHGGSLYTAQLRPVSDEAVDDVIIAWYDAMSLAKVVLEDSSEIASFSLLSAELCQIDNSVFMPISLPQLTPIDAVGGSLTASDKASLASIVGKAHDGRRVQLFLSGGKFSVGRTPAQENWRIEEGERAGMPAFLAALDTLAPLIVTRSGQPPVFARYINLSLARRRITAKRV